MIISKSFKHGWYYWFRFDRQKLLEYGEECHAQMLLDFFASLDNCPHFLFYQEPRASSMRKPRKYVHRIRHPITKFTKYAKDIYRNRYNSNHTRVEMFLLENDIKTVAIEVPVWFEANEAEEMGFTYPLTGHIDVLRLTDKIEVWDYKPKAEKERYASTQVYWYVHMLSKRLDIPIDDFRCGYFDEKICYFVEMQDRL
ncbi:MAG: hypothetical protein ACXQTP_00080 [Candidatus Methanofastidiosia archaeon]